MLMNLLLGLPTMVLCLLVQSLLLVMVMRYYYRNEYLLNSPSFWSSLIVITSIMLLLVVGNLVQVAVWAMLFKILGEFQQFSVAFYHSAVNFATLGYGDIVMSEERKLLGPLEAINGVLMIGISTAAMLAAFQDAVKKTIQARKTNTL
jgi:magnesium-transporting ATPase (P-type)